MKLASGFAFALALPWAASAADLSVRIQNVTEESGEIYVQVCTPETRDVALSGGCEPRAMAPAEDGVVVIFEDLDPGVYGVTMWHDVDGDGELRSNVMGIPREPLGYANDARGRFGPPGFDDWSFELGEEDLEIVVNLYRL